MLKTNSDAFGPARYTARSAANSGRMGCWSIRRRLPYAAWTVNVDSSKSNADSASPRISPARNPVSAATAILDRFLHHAEVITITGKSYRLKHKAHEDQPGKATPGNKKS